MARLTIRVDLNDSEGFGPGKARLLELIEAQGSIRAAAAAMGMSYRKAWLLLNDVQRAFATPVVATATGGSGGGGAALTEFGLALVRHYRTIERRATQAASSDLAALAAAAAAASRKSGSGPRGRRLPKRGKR